MTIHRSTFHKLAVSTFLLTASLGSAWAQDTSAVADRMKALLANQGMELAWTGISGDASSMVLEGVSVKAAGEKDGLPVGNVTLEGVEEADGGYTIDTVSTQPFSHAEDGVTLEASPFVMHDLTLPAENSSDPMASLMLYKSAELDSLTVKAGGKDAFTMNDFAVEITPPADGKAMEFSGGVDKFTGDLSLVDDPKSKAVIEALGYQTVSGNMEIAGSWQPTDGKMELSKYDVTVDNAGTFGMTFDMGNWRWNGVDPELAARTLAPHVRYVHCKGVREDKGKLKAVPLQAQDSDWQQLMAHFPKGILRAIEFPLVGSDLEEVTRRHVALLASV